MTAISRPLALVALLLGAGLLAGCTDTCTPQDVPTQVALTLLKEEARTLPILSSGATQIAGQDLPDSHGTMRLQVSVTHPGLTNQSLNFSDVAIHALRLDLSVGGRAIPVKLLKVEGGEGWSQAGADSWDGAAQNNSEITLWWAVDRDQATRATDVVLPEGAPYVATIGFDWSHRDCAARASGHSSKDVRDFVEASVNARTFQMDGQPVVTASASGVGLRANFTVRSGLEADVSQVTVRAVFLSNGTQVSTGAAGGAAATVPGVTGAVGGNASASAPVPTTGLVLFPTVRWSVGGEASGHATPAKPFSVYSADASGRYAASGTVLPVALPAGPGLYVVLVDVAYTPSDPTLGVTTDSFAAAVYAS